jgi:hypothetical protein
MKSGQKLKVFFCIFLCWATPMANLAAENEASMRASAREISPNRIGGDGGGETTIWTTPPEKSAWRASYPQTADVLRCNRLQDDDPGRLVFNQLDAGALFDRKVLADAGWNHNLPFARDD